VAVLLASGTTTSTLGLGIIIERRAEILTGAFFASITIVFCYSFYAFLIAASCSFIALFAAALACV